MSWTLGPFTRHSGPVVGRLPNLVFRCPVREADVRWAAKDIFNPGAVVRDGQVTLLVGGEDKPRTYRGTSRIGLGSER